MAPKTSKNTNLAANKRRRGKEPAETSTNPPQTQPLTQPPPYIRFISETAEERYHKIREYEFTKERGFDFVNLTTYPVFESTIRRRGWENLVRMVTKTSNKNLALEFFANAFDQKEQDYVSRVRGKLIEYRPCDINRVLGITAPEECDVEFRRNPRNWPETRAQWDELLYGLMRDGTGWKGLTVKPQRINTADLLPEYKAWASFILSTIELTSSSAEMITSRVFILLSLISDGEIDVGRLLSVSLKNTVSSKKTTLGHSCLINLLCQDADVPVEPSDIYIKSQGPINDSAMLLYEKLQSDFERGRRQQGGPSEQQTEQPQMMEEDPAPQMPQQQSLPPYFSEYVYSMANWAQDISSEIRFPPPFFPQPFFQAAEQHRQSSLRTNAYERFADEEAMENYFVEERQRAAEREQRIRAEYHRVRDEEAEHTQSMFQDLSQFPPSGPGGLQ